MKKFIIALAAIALLGVSGIIIAKNITGKETVPPETTAPVSSQIETPTGRKDQPTEPSSADEPSTSLLPQEKEHSFAAKILSVTDNVFELESLTDDNGISKKDVVKATVDRKNVFDSHGRSVRDDDFENFTSAKVTYYGDVLKSTPIFITAEKIVLSQREKCNIYFYINGKNINTLTVDKGAYVDSSDMPHAGAYCDDGYHFDYWMDENGEAVYALENIETSVVLNAKISHD